MSKSAVVDKVIAHTASQHTHIHNCHSPRPHIITFQAYLPPHLTQVTSTPTQLHIHVCIHNCPLYLQIYNCLLHLHTHKCFLHPHKYTTVTYTYTHNCLIQPPHTTAYNTLAHNCLQHPHTTAYNTLTQLLTTPSHKTPSHKTAYKTLTKLLTTPSHTTAYNTLTHNSLQRHSLQHPHTKLLTKPSHKTAYNTLTHNCLQHPHTQLLTTPSHNCLQHPHTKLLTTPSHTTAYKTLTQNYLQHPHTQLLTTPSHTTAYNTFKHTAAYTPQCIASYLDAMIYVWATVPREGRIASHSLHLIFCVEGQLLDSRVLEHGASYCRGKHISTSETGEGFQPSIGFVGGIYCATTPAVFVTRDDLAE